MDEAESFLMKSRVRSIWPHSRANWFAEVFRGGVSRGGSFGLAVKLNHVFLVCRGCRIARATAHKSFALGSRAYSGARSVEAARFMSVLVLASSSCSGVFQFPHCACGLVGRRIGRSRLRRPHAGGGRVNCAAWIKSRSVRVAVGIEMLMRSTPSKA